MGALYHLKQKLVDFCNVIQENVSRTDTVPSSKVVYDLKADSDTEIGKLKANLLWTNPSPTSDFGQQNITIDSNNYEYYIVTFKGHKSYANIDDFITIAKKPCVWSSVNWSDLVNGYIWARVFRITNTGIEFQSAGQVLIGTTITHSANTERMIPFRVYGTNSIV